MLPIECIGLSTVFLSSEMAVKPPWCNFFSSKFAKEHVVMLAVDEAHCITDWLVIVYRLLTP